MNRNNVNYYKPTIAELFSSSNGEKFVVPRYQRGYAWNEENIDRLWQDIFGVAEGEDYLLGTIVLNQPEGEFEKQIIDGQQRITSLILLFVALYLKLEEKGYTKFTNDIKNYYKKGEFEEKYDLLTLGKINKDFFIQILNLSSMGDFLKIKMEDIGNSSSKKIYKVLKKIMELIQIKFFEGKTDAHEIEKNLLGFIKKIKSNIFVIAITVPSYSEASKIFETLNNRGEELSNVDLVKNLLFQKAESEGFLSDVEKNWDTTIDIIGLDNLEQFFRYYTIAFSKLSSIYDRVDNILRSESTKTFSERILEFSKYYDTIISIENIEGIELELIHELHIYGVSQCYSVLMFGKSKFEKEYIKLLKAIVNLTLKFQVICGHNPNVLENLYSDIAMNIQNGTYDINKVIKLLKEKEPDKSEFKRKFKTREFIRNSNIVKVILSKIENSISTGEKIVNIGQIHLEHIMPKNIDIWLSDYSSNLEYKSLKNIHKEFINTIGNMTLLKDKINMSIKNSNFENKKSKAFSISQINLNAEINSCDSWTDKEIKSRADNLADKAYSIWDL